MAGVVLGLFSAVSELRIRNGAWSDAIAIVNGHPIAREDFDRSLAGLQSDSTRRTLLDDRRHVLERLIEDELLIQKALALGLGATEPNARKVLIRTLIDSVIANREEPKEQQLLEFYAANKALFRSPLLIAIEIDPADAIAPPSGLLPLDKLRDYLGSHADALATAKIGEWSGPQTILGRTVRLRVAERRGDETAAFDEARAGVLARYVQDSGSANLRAYIDALKASARIERFDAVQ
jgi:hypothetical protein